MAENSIVILIGFDNGDFTDIELVKEAKLRIRKMPLSGDFPAPEPPLSEVKAAMDDFFDAIIDAELRIISKAARNEKRAILVDLLKRLGLYVQRNCGNNRAVAASSGYKVKKEYSYIGALQKGQNVKIKNGLNTGDVVFSCNVILHALAYIWYYTQDAVGAETKWKTAVSTKTNTTVPDLIIGKPVRMKMAGVGSSDERVFSDEVTMTAVQ